MTTYIGRIGGMAPTPCVSGWDEETEPRVVFGGGPGTLSPRRARVYGTGSRKWSGSLNDRSFDAANNVRSLARRQALYGGSYRVIPCDAVDHNLFTPKATEELWDWTGLSVGPASSFPTVSAEGDDAPAMYGRVIPGGRAVSPHIPAVKIARMWGYAFAAGNGNLIYRVHSSSGTYNDVTPQAFSNASGVMSRVGRSFLPFATTVSVQLIVEATTNPVHFAWPSLAYKDNAYTAGRGCDSAFVSSPNRSVYASWGSGFEDSTYEITEVGE